jgi:hypothetical protein
MAGHNYSYRYSSRLVRWLTAVLGLAIVLLLLSEAACAYDWFMLGDAVRFIAARSTIAMVSVYLRMEVYGLVLLIILAYVLFFIWIYRTSANAHAMGADLSHSAGFSIGMFFVPGLNLFMPPMMMSELARASINAPLWRTQPKSILVALWWTLQLAASIGGIMLNFFTPARGAALAEFRTYFGWIIAFQLLSILHYAVMALLVGKISSKQRSQWDEFGPAQAEAIFS